MLNMRVQDPYLIVIKNIPLHTYARTTMSPMYVINVVMKNKNTKEKKKKHNILHSEPFLFLYYTNSASLW